MQFKRVNRDAPERLFCVFKANDAGIAADDVVQLELTAASVDGVWVVQPNTNELNAFCGIADAAIGNGSYGLVQLVEESFDAVKDRTLNTMALAGLIGRGAMGWDALLADARHGDARGRLEGLA